jgi:nicotinamidase-related amidase
MAENEKFDPQSTGLIVFDMQNGQFKTSDPVRNQWLSESRIVENAVSLIAAARASGVKVFYVRNNRRPDGGDQHDVITDQSLGGGGGGGARIENPNGIIDEVAPVDGDFVIDKIRMGGFSSTPLDTIFRAQGIKTVVICGVRTTVGVATTVRDGRDLGYNMVVASDATGGVAPEEHQWMLEHIFPIFGRVRTVSQIQAALS